MKPDTVLDVQHGAADQAALAAVDATGRVAVYETSNDGVKWDRTELEPAGQASTGHFVQQDGMVVGLLVNQTTSANFSAGDWYGKANGAWRHFPAPAGGSASAAGGAVWLAGGPARTDLYRSTDGGANWTKVRLPDQSPSSQVAVDPPEAVGTDTLLPVTVTDGPVTKVVWFSTGDGGSSWTLVASAPVRASLGVGVTVPSGAAGRDGLVAVAPDGTQLVRASRSGGQPSVISPNGLSGGVDSIDFTDAQTGWAQYSAGSCGATKQDCVTARGLVITRDGGQTWNPGSPG